MFYAHSTEDKSRRDWHRLRDHLTATSDIAAHFAAAFGAASAARLKRTLEPLDPVWRKEISPYAAGLMPSFKWSRDEKTSALQFGLLGRMIFSCLVDADYRDTESFYGQVRGEAKDRDWPALDAIIDPDQDSLRYYHLGKNWRRRVEHVGAKPAVDLGGTLIV